MPLPLQKHGMHYVIQLFLKTQTNYLKKLRESGLFPDNLSSLYSTTTQNSLNLRHI